MTSPLSTHFCPWLGSEIDRATRYGYPSISNICFSPCAAHSLTLAHQEDYCLSDQYTQCPYFVEPESAGVLEKSSRARPIDVATKRAHGSLLIAGGLVTLTAVLLLIWAVPQYIAFSRQGNGNVERITIPLSAKGTATMMPTATDTREASLTATVKITPTITPFPTPSLTIVQTTPLRKSTPTTTALRIPSPRLIYPTDGSTLRHTQVEFRWIAVDQLQVDEWYDIQVRRKGEIPRGVSWSNESNWKMPADFPSGYYQWRIVVIRGRDGNWLEDLSLPSETWTFNRE